MYHFFWGELVELLRHTSKSWPSVNQNPSLGQPSRRLNYSQICPKNTSYFYLHLYTLYTHKNWPNVGIDMPYTLSIINWNPPGSWLRLNRFSTHGFQPVGNPEDWSLAETLIRAWKTFLGMWVCWKIQIASYPWIFCITYNCTLFI